jgi:hypothetical protein
MGFGLHYRSNYVLRINLTSKGKGNDSASVMLQSIRCEGRGYKDVY